jgi:PBP1b-binding outer membrane lipoprotein LpoB
MKKLLAVVVVVAFLLTSCSTLVHVETNPKDAVVRIDGVPGNTQSLPDTAWTDFDLTVEKAGYKPYHGQLRKEIKTGPLIAGIFFLWPLIWVYGPVSYQYIPLEPLD